MENIYLLYGTTALNSFDRPLMRVSLYNNSGLVILAYFLLEAERRGDKSMFHESNNLR